MTLTHALTRIERQHVVRGRRQTIVLEQAYWDALHQAAAELDRPVREIVAEACANTKGRSGGRGESYNRAIRMWVVDFFRQKLERAEGVMR